MVGPFGGITAATLLQAVMQHPDRLGEPLSLTVNYAGALARGPFTVQATPVRTNRSTQHWTLSILQPGADGALAVGGLDRRRDPDEIVGRLVIGEKRDRLARHAGHGVDQGMVLVLGNPVHHDALDRIALPPDHAGSRMDGGQKLGRDAQRKLLALDGLALGVGAQLQMNDQHQARRRHDHGRDGEQGDEPLQPDALERNMQKFHLRPYFIRVTT